MSTRAGWAEMGGAGHWLRVAGRYSICVQLRQHGSDEPRWLWALYHRGTCVTGWRATPGRKKDRGRVQRRAVRMALEIVSTRMEESQDAWQALRDMTRRRRQ